MTYFFVVLFVSATFGDPAVTIETKSLETRLLMKKTITRHLLDASMRYTVTECVERVPAVPMP